MNLDEDKKTISRHLALFACVALLGALPGLLHLFGFTIETGAQGYKQELVRVLAGEVLDGWDHALLQGATAYTLLEWTVVLLALGTAILAFAHFHVRRDAVSMVVSVAAFWVGVLTAFQLLAFHGFSFHVLNLAAFVQFNWTISQSFMAVLLLTTAVFVLWQGNRQDYFRDHHMVILGVVISTIAYVLIVWTARAPVLPRMSVPDQLVTRPYDLIPLTLFVVALVVALPLLHRKCKSSFSLALWVSSLPLAMSQFYMAIPSIYTFDAGFTAAQLNKTMAFTLIFGGLVWDYAIVCQREKTLEEKLSVSDQKIRMLFNNAEEAIIIFDANRRVLSWNPRATEIFGETKIEAHDEDVLDMIFPGPADLNDHGRSRLRQRLNDFERHDDEETLKQLCEAPIQRRDETQLTVEYSVVPARKDGEEIFAVFARDITARKQMQVRLAQVDRLVAVGTLAAGVVHEIKNPLTYVISNVALAQETVEDLRSCEQSLKATLTESAPDGPWKHELHRLEALSEEIFVAMDSTESGADRIHRIIDDMQVFSQRRSADLHPVSIPQTLELALRMTRGDLQQGARIEVDVDEVPAVYADETRLSQVFVNLIVNAIQAMQDESIQEPVLYIEVEQGHHDEVVIRFRDNGPGMSETVKARIFQPFFTTKPPGVGTGLGLSLSQAFIEQFGGEIDVESSPGQGTTFEIRLPGYRPNPTDHGHHP